MSFSISSSHLKRITLIIAVAMLAATFQLASPPAISGAAADDGVTVFKKKCVACHALDGSGNTAQGKKLSVKDLRSAEVQKKSDGQLNGLIAKGKGKMPAYGKSLNEDQIKELVAHVRSLKK